MADTRGKKLVPSHESEALQDKQKRQMKTFCELAECLARIPPKITSYGRLFKYNYVGCLQPLMFSANLQSKGTRISSRKQGDFVGFRSIRSSTSERWLQKSGKHVGPNFTLKPNTILIPSLCACNPAARPFARELTKTELRRSVRSLYKPSEISAL